MDEGFTTRLPAIFQERAIPAASRDDCEMIWRGLIERTLEVVEMRAEPRATSLVVRHGSASCQPFRQRNREVLERCLLGTPRKVVASELGISTSTVCNVIKNALRDLVPCRSPAEITTVLVALLHAARGARPLHALSIVHDEVLGEGSFVVVVQLEVPLLERLPAAERAVLHLLAAGHSYAAIAAQRNTSYRTVANQIATGSKRLGISGRYDLIRMLVCEP